jgi:hypothetical protein
LHQVVRFRVEEQYVDHNRPLGAARRNLQPRKLEPRTGQRWRVDVVGQQQTEECVDRHESVFHRLPFLKFLPAHPTATGA